MGYLIKKINETGDVKRRERSGRPKSSRTENNINAVKELISSQEDKPGTHATPDEISKMMDIPRTLIIKITAKDLKLQVSVAVSKVGKSSIFFVEPGEKVDGAYYREKLLASMIPEMDRLTGYQTYVFI